MLNNPYVDTDFHFLFLMMFHLSKAATDTILVGVIFSSLH